MLGAGAPADLRVPYGEPAPAWFGELRDASPVIASGPRTPEQSLAASDAWGLPVDASSMARGSRPRPIAGSSG